MQNNVLDEIEKVGWRLDRADAVFTETGATSSSRVMSTGEGTVTRWNHLRPLHLPRHLSGQELRKKPPAV